MKFSLKIKSSNDDNATVNIFLDSRKNISVNGSTPEVLSTHYFILLKIIIATAIHITVNLMRQLHSFVTT